MDKNLPDIEHLFKAALENEEEMPEPKVWKAIDAILDKDDVLKIKKKYEDLKKVAFLLFFLLLGLSIYELEKPGFRNNNISHKEIVTGKSSIADAKAESSIVAKKLTEPDTLNSDRTKTFGDKASVHKNSSANITQPKYDKGLVKSRNEAKDNKETIFNSELLSQNSVAASKPAAIIKTEIDKAHKEKPGERNMKTNETLLLRDNHILFAQQTNRRKLDSVNTISLPRSPTLIKVIAGIDDKNSVVKNINTKNGKPSAFSLNIFFSPDFASYRLQDNVPGNNLDEANEIEKNELHEFSSTIGALVEYKATKHWSIRSGLSYSNTNITVAPKTIYAQPDNYGSIKYLLNTSSGYGYVLPSFSRNPVTGDSLYAFTSTHSLQYLGLPVVLKYTVTMGKFSFNAIAGTAVNYLIKGKVETSVEDGTNNEPEVVDNLQGLKKIYFNALAGVGIEYNLGKKIAVTFAPTYRFALNSINKEASVKSYPNSIGLSTGLRFTF